MLVLLSFAACQSRMQMNTDAVAQDVTEMNRMLNIQ
jgi:hypothetical protein